MPRNFVRTVNVRSACIFVNGSTLNVTNEEEREERLGLVFGVRLPFLNDYRGVIRLDHLHQIIPFSLESRFYVAQSKSEYYVKS